MPTFGSLFAGIGGIDLGLERAGWSGRWQVEWDDYASRVLARHWPDVARYGDVHDVHGRDACPVANADRHEHQGGSPANRRAATELLAHPARDARRIGNGDGEADGCPNCLEPVDLIAGGFPCQPFSFAGKQQRLADDRWLWPEFERCIRELRPRYVLVENVPGLLVGGGMDAVLGGLADLGYDAEWESIPAAAVGAPHLRYRVWIVASRSDPDREWREAFGDPDPRHGRPLAPQAGEPAGVDCGPALADPASIRRERDGGARGWRAGSADGGGAVADTNSHDAQRLKSKVDDAHIGQEPRERPAGLRGGDGWDQWSIEPDVGRVAHGVPARVDRLRSLGNAVVPQVAEWIGRRLIEIGGMT